MSTVTSSLPKPFQFDYRRNVKLLNIQIKQVMYELLHVVTHDVLYGLDSELRNATKASWATTFSVILVLGIWIEDLEVSVDARIVHDVLNCCLPTTIRDQTITWRQTVDDRYANCMDRFHSIYLRNGKKGFNPTRNGLDQPTFNLIIDIKTIIKSLGKYYS
jgi:hypothetical protein